MSVRDDFSAPTKVLLAKRAAYRCSYPPCRCSTQGPAASPEGTTNIGVAAHIEAAAGGGPRYNSLQTSEQRSSADNGVWLCAVHAKLVDDDEARFTVPLLKEWKRVAECSAALEIGRPTTTWRRAVLPTYSAALTWHGTRASFHTQIANFLSDTGVVQYWGLKASKEAHNLIYEIALNAIQHSGVQRIQLEVDKLDLTLGYEGDRFGLRDLLATPGRGGRQTVEGFIEQEGGVRALNFSHDSGMNYWIISDLEHPDAEVSPCCIRPTVDGYLGDDDHLGTLVLCDEVHVFLPELFSLSDGYELIGALEEEFSGQPLVFHNASTFALSDILRESFPVARFVASKFDSTL
jgi:hypothetical protein